MTNDQTPITNSELLTRIRRIYASINMLHEFNMCKLPAKVRRSGRIALFYQDFTGGLSSEDIQNAAHMVIHNIANLQDHLRRWAVHNGKDKARVDTIFKESQSLKMIQDLSNGDKHGYPPRGDSYSGIAPRLTNVRRQMQLTTKAETGSSSVMTFGPRGVPKISGSDTACAVITSDVVDKDGNTIGDLLTIEQDAVTVWETLLADFGICR